MKKTVIFLSVIILMVVTFKSYGDWFEPIMNIRMSYNLDDDVELAYDNGNFALVDILPSNTIAFDITVGMILWKFLWAEGQFITYNAFLDFNPMGGMFSPYQMEYGFRGGLQWKGFRIGYEHWCYHPIKASSTYNYTQRFGGVDQVYIEFNMSRFLLQKTNKK